MSEAPIDKFRGVFSFLSNFYPADTGFDGEVYPSAEHAYQASKTINKEERAKILFAETPGKAKRLGATLTLREGWDDMRVEVMASILKSKFENPELRTRLLETRGLPLIEGNTWGDTFWGVCNGMGKNHLGRLLMLLRDEIASEEDQ